MSDISTVINENAKPVLAPMTHEIVLVVLGHNENQTVQDGFSQEDTDRNDITTSDIESELSIPSIIVAHFLTH